MVEQVPLVVSKADVAAAYKTAFSTPDGQIILADLMRRFSFTRRTTFVQGDEGGRIMAANEGSRTVLVHIGIMLDARPEDLQDYEETQHDEGVPK